MDNIKTARSTVILKEHNITNVSGSDYPHMYPGEDLSFNINEFKKTFKVQVGSRSNESELEFDLIGIDASIANALRRTLLSEVPTMAIETVYMLKNTSIVADEILSHRLGLVPIKADARCFEYKAHQDSSNDLNTIVFELHVKCTKNPEASSTAIDPKDKYINSNVFAADLKWKPEGEQSVQFKDCPIEAMYQDIVLAKLRPGQEIQAILHCQKGIGKEHAKWSPVGTASYRLLPEIKILKPIIGLDAHAFQKCFPPGTIEVVEVDGNESARVLDPRNDTGSRECFRHPEFKESVQLGRIRDHFIFSIESISSLGPDILFESAIDILIEKCNFLRSSMNEMGLASSIDSENDEQMQS